MVVIRYRKKKTDTLKEKFWKVLKKGYEYKLVTLIWKDDKNLLNSLQPV